MPGSKGNRTKGNVKPSSSSRAAELLSQSGATGFIGFGNLGGAQAYVPVSQAFDDVDSCLDSDFRLVLRKLNKRDATTKIKTLGELSALCREKDDATLEAVLPFWPRLYNKLAIDVDPKVREDTQKAMGVLVGRVRRNLAPYLRSVMGVWILARNDPYPTVASAANRAFSVAFPPDKQENAIVYCKQAALEYLTDNVINQTPATLSDPKTTDAVDMDRKYKMVVSSSLLGLRQLLLTLPASHLNDQLKGQLRGVLNVPKFWSMAVSLVSMESAAFYWFVGSVCHVVPDVAEEFLRNLCPRVLGAIDKTDPAVTSALWDAVLACVKFVPSCWGYINWQKAFWPKLKALLQNGCRGSATTVAPNFLPLLSCLPLDTAGGATVFLPRVLDLFKEGFASDSVSGSVSETSAWSQAFLECTQFSFRVILTAGDEDCHTALSTILLDQLLPVVEASVMDAKLTLSRSGLHQSVAAFLQSLELNPDTAALARKFLSQLSTDLVDSLESVDVVVEKQTRVVSLVKALLFPGRDSGKFKKGGVVGKTERVSVRFAKENEEEEERDREVRKDSGVEVSDDVRCLLKALMAGAYKQFCRGQGDRDSSSNNHNNAHFKLFVNLAALHFPQDVADHIISSVDRDPDTQQSVSQTEDETDSHDTLSSQTSVQGEGEKSEQKNATNSDTADFGRSSNRNSHSQVIERVVLPVLGGQRGRGEVGEEVVEHALTLLFACLPYLSTEASTQLWDDMLQTLDSMGALRSLLERALERRKVVTQVCDWLSCPRLHARLCDLVATVISQHASLPPHVLEQGWKIICLVLSANDDSGETYKEREPVFPSSWVVDIASKVGQELTMLAARPVEQQQVQLVVSFVAKAALSFFTNLKISVCIDEGRDVIVALLMVDLDPNLTITGEAGSMLRQAWTSGLGLRVRGTGGLLCDSSTLTSVCRVVREAVLTRTHSPQHYMKVIEVTEAVIKTARDHLPREETNAASGDGVQSYNPLLLALVSELLVPLPASPALCASVTRHHCLSGQLPISLAPNTDPSSQLKEGREEEQQQTVTSIVYSSLFNLHLLKCARSCFKLSDLGSEGGGAADDSAGGGNDEDDDGGGEEAKPSSPVLEENDGGRSREEEEEKEVETLLSVVRSLCLAATWCQMEAKVTPELTKAVEDLSCAVSTYFMVIPLTLRHAVITRAFHSLPERVENRAVFTYLAELHSSQQGVVDQEFFLQLHQSGEEEVDSGAEVLVPWLPQWRNADLSQLTSAVLTSLPPDSFTSHHTVSCLRVLTAVFRREPELMASTHREMLLSVLTLLKTLKDNDDADDDSSVFLFSCDIREGQTVRVAVNVAIMQFLTALVTSDLLKLTPDLWDFVLCSLVSWVETVNSCGVLLQSSRAVQAFFVEVCGLVAGVSRVMQCCSQQPDLYPPNLLTEWTEFFAQGVYAPLLPLFVSLVDEVKNTDSHTGSASIMLTSLGSALAGCPQEQITAHSLPLLLSASEDSNPVPESLQTVVNHLCPILTCPSPPAQVAAFQVLKKIIPLLPAYYKEQEEAEAAAAARDGSDLKARAPPVALMKVLDDCAAAMDVVLESVPMETTFPLTPGSEEYQFALGYLLSWQLLLHLFHSAQATGRTEYAVFLKEHRTVDHLLHHLFRLMPHSSFFPSSSSSSSLTSASPSITPLKPTSPCEAVSSPKPATEDKSSSKSVQGRRSVMEDGTTWDSLFSSTELPLSPLDVGRQRDIQRASCVVYAHCLHVIPVLVRQWWKDQDRKTAAYVDKYTTKRVSQQLVQREMQTLSHSDSSIKDVAVKANALTRQVTAVYTTEDAEDLRAEIQITLPENFPLGEISVEAPRHAVLKQAQWDRLLLQISMYLHHLNGPIVEGVRLWKRNIEKKLEGLEECFICYAIVNGANMELPRMPCATCKKKFHSSCLYKWWNSSQNSTCPLCRSNFS